MSMHKKPLTELERRGLEAHGLNVGMPSLISNAFQWGVAWALEQTPSNSRLAQSNLALSARVEALERELDAVRRAKENAVAQARAWAQEARTHRGALIMSCGGLADGAGLNLCREALVSAAPQPPEGPNDVSS